MVSKKETGWILAGVGFLAWLLWPQPAASFTERIDYTDLTDDEIHKLVDLAVLTSTEAEVLIAGSHGQQVDDPGTLQTAILKVQDYETAFWSGTT